ncbi:hypothetical protein SANTM175S_04040 [Streptomyces antimycoticus]
MGAYLQGSLFDQTDDIGLGSLRGMRRTQLGSGAWIDLLPGWLRGADDLFSRLVAEVPWKAERRHMYEQVVDVPRLLAFYGAEDPLPHPVLSGAREALSTYYAGELAEPFTTAGLCYYRDGQDSVAWHGDRIGRGRSEDTMVAILSVGAPLGPAAPPAWRRQRHTTATRPRRSAGDGRLLPADLGTRDPQILARHRSTDQHPVPPHRREVKPPAGHLATWPPGRLGPRRPDCLTTAVRRAPPPWLFYRCGGDSADRRRGACAAREVRADA